MNKFLAGAAVIAATTSLAAAAPAAAESDPGRVIVFSTELTEVAVWEDPDGCVKLPLDAHVLINQTDKTVITYGDPLCLAPALSVAPGYGAHVASGTGSFSVVE